jgi:hypothetical protein
MEWGRKGRKEFFLRCWGVGGEHHEFMLGGMGETNPRKANEDNKIQENSRNCPVGGHVIVVNFELQKVPVNVNRSFLRHALHAIRLTRRTSSA